MIIIVVIIIITIIIIILTEILERGTSIYVIFMNLTSVTEYEIILPITTRETFSSDRLRLSTFNVRYELCDDKATTKK